jgi:hypothetical protein
VPRPTPDARTRAPDKLLRVPGGQAPASEQRLDSGVPAEEVFYVLWGELDLLAFQPTATANGDWRTWRSEAGATVFRGGPGSFMFVPAGCPHAFFNPGSEPARMLFLVSPAGHEMYLQELTDLLAASGPPDQAEIAALGARHDIHQLTPLTNHAPGT